MHRTTPPSARPKTTSIFRIASIPRESQMVIDICRATHPLIASTWWYVELYYEFGWYWFSTMSQKITSYGICSHTHTSDFQTQHPCWCRWPSYLFVCVCGLVHAKNTHSNTTVAFKADTAQRSAKSRALPRTYWRTHASYNLPAGNL